MSRHISEVELAQAIVDCGPEQLATALLSDSEVCDYLAGWYLGESESVGESRVRYQLDESGTYLVGSPGREGPDD